MKVACPAAAVRSGAPGGHAGERVGEASNPGPDSEDVLAEAFAERVGMLLHVMFGRLCDGQLKGGGRLKVLEGVQRTSFVRKMATVEKTFADAAQTEATLAAAAADELESHGDINNGR